MGYWRTVDHDGNKIDILVQIHSRDKRENDVVYLITYSDQGVIYRMG